MLFLRVVSFVSPYLLGIAIVALAVLGVQNRALEARNAKLTTDLISARADLELSRANVSRLEAGIDAQNAATQAQSDAGRERLSATEARLRAWPDPTLPPDWSAPLTGATACERAEEVRGRLLEMIR